MFEKLKNHFEILYNDSPNPCSLTDIETHQIVFMNNSMQKMLKEASGYVHGEDESIICHERMYGNVDPCQFCQNHTLEKDEFVESYIFNDKLKKYFRVNNTLVSFQDRKYNLCKYFITSSYASQLITFEEALTKSVDIFSLKDNFEEMTNAFLSLIGNFYEAEKSYVIYLNEEKTNVSEYYRWSADEEITVSHTDNFSISRLLDFMKNNGINGVADINSNDYKNSHTSDERKILEELNISNFVICEIVNENKELLGAIGISNRAEKPFDPRLLKSVSNFVQETYSKTDMQEELRSISETDFLTGFYSRPKYASYLTSLEKNPPKQLGIIFININGLRKTNEYMGFAKGDEQIVSASKMLREFLSEEFYRVSGDEFVCFCNDATEELFLKKVNRLRNKVKKTGEFPFAIGHVWKQGSFDPKKLVAEADTVMYINKQEYYHSTHQINNSDNDRVLNDLLNYISNDEFLVYLQPQINLKDETVIGAEALIRRFDKQNNKMVFPDQFIPLYEQKSIIRHVDIFVINKVCQILNKWREYGAIFPVSVNLSRVTLIEFDIVSTISKICDNYNIPREYICIEVTERVGLIENDVASTLIDDFKANGFRISLDDFGCAYSNIITLAKISVDEVKIDKSLVDDLIDNEKNRIIVDSMIMMCNKFSNTNTLAEGVETKEQADILRQFGCTYAQGYYYARPMPNEDFFEKYIKKED